jgi:indolepyruvate ferredoxin oxidoreductase, alpha subunit
MSELVVLGDEALAIGAVDSGVSSAYGYPGTPSTEILEYLLDFSKKNGFPHTAWCANEKTAYEEGLGTSFAGKRALITMKHVGLNVAADPFINSALLKINGGVVVAVADDPGMHSSQNEQDSRFYADFARIICLEPANQQEVYEMTRAAYDISEKFEIPVMVRLVTRLAHSRGVVSTGKRREENPLNKTKDKLSWMLLPALARKRFDILLDKQKDLKAFTEKSEYNTLELNKSFTEYGVITTGLARNYFQENVNDLTVKPSHLHISTYPVPGDKIRALAQHVDKIIVLEEGYAFVEKYLRGILPQAVQIDGKIGGSVPKSGELNPDNIRTALGLEPRKTIDTGKVFESFELPGRPPQFCAGCPHADSFDFIKKAIEDYDLPSVTSDIGCYALGALPPYSVPETIIDMGASVSVAKGAAEAGLHPVIAVIGDSTFLHSGLTPLMDAVAAETNMTVVVVDNSIVAMTGGQETLLPSENLKKVAQGIGVDPDHIKSVEAHRKVFEENTRILKDELDYKGLSLIIASRECVESAKKKKQGAKA